VLVSGTETFLAERAIRQLRDFLKLEDPSLEISDVQADSYAPGELLTLASPSLFGEPRLIRVSNVEKCSDTFLAEALDYLENPAEDTYVVLRHGGGVRGKKLLDTIRSGLGDGIEIVCSELKKDTEKYEFAVSEENASRSVPCANWSGPSPTTWPNCLPPASNSSPMLRVRSPRPPSTDTTAVGSKPTRSRWPTGPSPVATARRSSPFVTPSRRGRTRCRSWRRSP
jgi:hypothetical protein